MKVDKLFVILIMLFIGSFVNLNAMADQEDTEPGLSFEELYEIEMQEKQDRALRDLVFCLSEEIRTEREIAAMKKARADRAAEFKAKAEKNKPLVQPKIEEVD